MDTPSVVDPFYEPENYAGAENEFALDLVSIILFAACTWYHGSNE